MNFGSLSLQSVTSASNRNSSLLNLNDNCATTAYQSLISNTTCLLCGYESGRISNLKRHMKTMHEMKQGSDLFCCDIRFEDKSLYRAHCRQFHKNGHECSICHRLFSRRALLRRHHSVHSGLKDFRCDLCSYASSHKSNLERHLKTHTKRSKRGRESRVQPDPDSTTTLSSSTFPILRTMLDSNPNPKSGRSRAVKPKLSHSIDSILRPDPPRRDKSSTVTSPTISSTTTTTTLESYKSESPPGSLAEVNWAGIDGRAEEQTVINHSSVVTPDLNEEPKPMIPINLQESRFPLSGSDYLRLNLFSPHYYLSHYLANYYPQTQHPTPYHPYPYLYYNSNHNNEEALGRPAPGFPYNSFPSL